MYTYISYLQEQSHIPTLQNTGFLTPGICKMTHWTVRKNILDNLFKASKSSKCSL